MLIRRRSGRAPIGQRGATAAVEKNSRGKSFHAAIFPFRFRPFFLRRPLSRCETCTAVAPFFTPASSPAGEMQSRVRNDVGGSGRRWWYDAPKCTPRHMHFAARFNPADFSARTRQNCRGDAFTADDERIGRTGNRESYGNRYLAK